MQRTERAQGCSLDLNFMDPQLWAYGQSGMLVSDCCYPCKQTNISTDLGLSFPQPVQEYPDPQPGSDSPSNQTIPIDNQKRDPKEKESEAANPNSPKPQKTKKMPVFKTPFNGYAVKFSPFYESRLAVATAQNFGILGNGRLHVLELSPAGPISEFASFDTADGVYDVTWSESHESLLIAAVADGSVKLYDLALPPASNPVRSLQEHSREVHSLDFNPVRRDSFLSSSWDDTIKLWTLDRPTSVRTFKEHAYCVYSSVWNPRHADVFASASGDCTIRVWDVREPGSTMILPAHEFEILACDWNKYDDCVLVSASVDKSIKVWDVRNFRIPVSVLNGHSYAVRKVKFSPHRRGAIASCSYDMTVCLWDYMVEDALIGRYDHHTEFAVGVDMSVLVEGLLASTGWDELVYVWQHGTDPRAP